MWGKKNENNRPIVFIFLFKKKSIHVSSEDFIINIDSVGYHGQNFYSFGLSQFLIIGRVPYIYYINFTGSIFEVK